MLFEQQTTFRLFEGDEKVGEIVVLSKGDVADIIHTEVSPEHQGKGLGEKLVAKALEFIKKEEKEVKASCSYAAHKIESLKSSPSQCSCSCKKD